MNDDVEQRLSRLTPRGVRPELREQVLGAVASELQVAECATASQAVDGGGCRHKRESDLWRRLLCRQPPPSPWLRRAAMAVAASLLLGIGLNVWVSKASDASFGPAFRPSADLEGSDGNRKGRRDNHRRPNRPMGLPPAHHAASARRRRGSPCEVLRASKATHRRTTNRLEGFVS